jgi:hypothetical protein
MAISFDFEFLGKLFMIKFFLVCAPYVVAGLVRWNQGLREPLSKFEAWREIRAGRLKETAS